MKIPPLPRSTSAEQYILSSVLFDSDRSFDVFNSLTLDDFYSEKHKKIFNAMGELRKVNSGIDLLTLKDQLEKMKSLDSVGLDYLAELSSNGAVPSNVKHYIKIAKEKTYQREVVKGSINVLQAVYKKSSDEEAEKKLGELITSKERLIKPRKPSKLYDLIDKAVDEIKNDRSAKIGIKNVDFMTDGISPGQVLTILGTTGNFKTATMQNILNYYTLRYNRPAFFFQLEMSKAELGLRAMQMLGGYDYKDAKRCIKYNDDKFFQKAAEVTARLTELNFVTESHLTFDNMKNYIREFEEIHERKVGMVGLDFIQLIDAPGKDARSKMDEAAKQQKRFAKEMDTVLVVASQVTGVEDATVPLTMMNIRDSKTLNQTSDYIIGLWLDKNDRDIQYVGLLKNRRSDTGQDARRINRKRLTFEEID